MESQGPKRDESPPMPASPTFDDRFVMAIGIPAFGLSIPVLSGLYGALSPSQPAFWGGALYFLALAAAIWLGNRWLLVQQRRHLDWFAQPARKLMILIAANVLYTAPLTVGCLAGWYWMRGLPLDAGTVQLVALTNVICVVFVTHAYETVFLIRERESDMTRVDRLERKRAEAELAALTAQLDPHFLFNSLNTLGHVIGRDPRRAREFCDRLADVYRYVLASRGRQLVPLADELAFLASYHDLLALRFGSAIALAVDPRLVEAGGDPGRSVPPLALQTLLENAVKHNGFEVEAPLRMRVFLAADAVRFVRERRPRTSVLPGAGLGLRNLDERCRLLAGRGLVVDASDGRFEVAVPIARR
ncbi:MAG TPA: histidine kinase [Caldimonas sp.]|nr:histidine kinase [Caldimonas sp.]HEX2542040.1 histidine kinase [Caldimonas sp.]